MSQAATPPVPAPDATGRMAYVGGVPSSTFPPGSYEVRLTLAQMRLELAP